MKVCYIISGLSVISSGNQFELTACKLKERFGININFLLLGDVNSNLEKRMFSLGFKVKSIYCKKKSDWPKALFLTILYLIRNRVNIIHCHLLAANVIGLVAGILCLIPFRIYTRHHAMEHHKRHKKSLIFDYLSNILSTHIISESEVVTNILRNLENVNSSKIYQFSPAIDLNRYANKDPNLREKMLQKYDLKESDIVIGVCSRFDYYKGLKYVIEGFSLAAKKHKNIKLIFFGASGIEFDSLSRLAKNKLPNNTYQFVKYEKNILGAYAIMDIFIHVPIAYDEEAFGLVYVEAMASSIACVFTLSGISAKLLKHNNNALVVGYKSSSDINTALQRLIKNKGLRNKIGIQAKKDVIKYFPENEVYENLANLYKKLTNKSSN